VPSISTGTTKSALLIAYKIKITLIKHILKIIILIICLKFNNNCKEQVLLALKEL